MKRYLIMLSLLSLTLTACGKTTNDTVQGELPAIVFLVRTDISDALSSEEIEKQNIAVKSLGFYDKNGSYYISSNPDLNSMDNQTLIAEYEAGHLTGQIQYYKSCDTDTLAEQYQKLYKIYQKGQFEIVVPELLPDVEAEQSTWYGYYYDKDGNLLYHTIHQKKRMTHLYTDNDTVNDAYDWINESFRNEEPSESS